MILSPDPDEDRKDYAMKLQELENYRIASVHYPGWDDYFDWCYRVKDEGTHFTINRAYTIDKSKVVEIDQECNKVSIKMSNGQTIVLTLME